MVKANHRALSLALNLTVRSRIRHDCFSSGADPVGAIASATTRKRDRLWNDAAALRAHLETPATPVDSARDVASVGPQAADAWMRAAPSPDPTLGPKPVKGLSCEHQISVVRVAPQTGPTREAEHGGAHDHGL